MGCRGSFVIRENGINTYLYDRHFGAGIMPDIFYGVDSTLSMFGRGREDETILNEEQTVISYKKSTGDILNYTTSVESGSTLALGKDLFQILKDRETVPLLHQRDVYDCLYIDEQNKTIHVFWGYPSSFDPLGYQLQYWSGWQVKWIDEGYVGHLKLIDYKQDDLLFSKEEAANGVIKMVKQPIERWLNKVKQKSEPNRIEEILHWENQLIFLDELKQEWLEKIS